MLGRHRAVTVGQPQKVLACTACSAEPIFGHSHERPRSAETKRCAPVKPGFCRSRLSVSTSFVLDCFVSELIEHLLEGFRDV